MAGVVINSEGVIVSIESKKVSCVSPLVAEAHALLLAASLAKANGWDSVARN